MTIFKEGDCLPESESIKPRFIILASGSERRMACLQQLTALPGIVGITSVPVAEAHNTDDLTIVAQSKIDALPSEYNNGFGLPYSEVEVWKVAADTQTLVPIMHDGRSIQLSSKGKPESIWAARTKLQMVLAVAEQTDQYPQYGVESASVLNGQHPYLTKRTITTLKLNPDKLREVITHFG